MLRVAGTVHRLGKAKIGGTQTTRYGVTMTAAGIVSGLRAEGKDELAEGVDVRPRQGAAAEDLSFDSSRLVAS